MDSNSAPGPRPVFALSWQEVYQAVSSDPRWAEAEAFLSSAERSAGLSLQRLWTLMDQVWDTMRTQHPGDLSRFLDAYYTANYHRDALSQWVAMGSPAECIESIRAFVDAGATTITLRLTGYDQRAQFKRVTEEVLPAFA